MLVSICSLHVLYYASRPLLCYFSLSITINYLFFLSNKKNIVVDLLKAMRKGGPNCELYDNEKVQVSKDQEKVQSEKDF